MSLESKSRELKEIVATYNSDWLLGDLAALMHAGKKRASDQLGELSSPLRQLYYLAGLNVTSSPDTGFDIMFNKEKWQRIVDLLNEIEIEYSKLFLPAATGETPKDWDRIVRVAMPSFLAYFNQGPLNYEEQVINWVRDIFPPFDMLIQKETGISLEEFISFYDRLDELHHINFQAHSTRKDLLRPNWDKYTKIKMGVPDDVPFFIREMMDKDRHIHYYMSDHGIIDRFYAEELVTDSLDIDKIKKIIGFLSISRSASEFLYYTETKPGNPLYERPILDIGGNMYQVFEVKQVIHAISSFLEKIVTGSQLVLTKYIEVKGNKLETQLVSLLSTFFGPDCKVFQSYFVDNCEQDILILWEKYAFIIEAKGYNIQEPFRNPEKAYNRIKNDFKKCIGYGYEQTRRVEQKFVEGMPLLIKDKNGKLLQEVDTTSYEYDFSIIVNLQSFGQIQCDLSTLITLEDEEDVYPWAIKWDDLEIFLRTMIMQKRNPKELIDFLLMRETLHGKLICADELEICGGFLSRKLQQKQTERVTMVNPAPEWGNIFDDQYQKGMGFPNEKRWEEKRSGKYIFW